jgi:hypothetical protein
MSDEARTASKKAVRENLAVSDISERVSSAANAILATSSETLLAELTKALQQCVTPDLRSTRYLTSHPGVRVCPGPNPDPVGQAETVRRGLNQGYDNTMSIIRAQRGYW